MGSQTATDGTSTALVATTSSAIGDLVPTTTTVTPDPSSAASGVDEAVTVTVTSPSGVGVPSGSITVLDNGAPSPSCLPESLSAVSPPTVTCTLQAAVGDDISAEYSGDGTFDASSGSADVTAVGTPPPVGNPPPPPVELPVGAVGGPLAAVALGVGLFGVQRRRSRRARDVAGR